jgi:hypothetical protein
LFLFAFLLRVACFTGLTGADDLHYSRYAQLIAGGDFTPRATHWATRYGLLLPVALVYSVAGVSEWTTVAVPLVASSMAVVLLALIGFRLFGARVALVAAVLQATFPIELRYGSILVPEALLTCLVLFAVLAYVRTIERPTTAAGACCGFLVGIAYLAKESAIFIAPALALDAALRRQWRRAIGIAIGAFAVLVLEQASYFVSTGDVLFRLHAMALHNQGLSGDEAFREELLDGIDPSDRVTTQIGDAEPGSAEKTAAESSASEAHHVAVDVTTGHYRDERWLARRLLVSYPRRMLIPHRDFGFHSLLTLIVAAVAVLHFWRDRRVWLMLLLSSVPWMYVNFGSTSLSSYIPLPVLVRYIAFVYPPLFLLVSLAVADVATRSAWSRRLVIAGVAALSISGIVTGLSIRASDYRTNHVAVLREIADIVKERHITSICFDTASDQRIRWPETLKIFLGGRLPRCFRGRGLTVGDDPLGLPFAASFNEPPPASSPPR